MLVFHAWQVGSDSEYFKTDIQVIIPSPTSRSRLF
jgi:hypothetical protein